MAPNVFPDFVNGPAGERGHEAIQEKTQNRRDISILMGKLQRNRDEPRISRGDPRCRTVHSRERTRKTVAEGHGPPNVPGFVTRGKKQKLVNIPVAVDQPEQRHSQRKRRDDSERGRLQRSGDAGILSCRYHEIRSPRAE
jgi:hypothetical protein